MTIPVNSIILFRHALHVWSILFLLTCLPVLDELWLTPLSPDLPFSSWSSIFTHAFNGRAAGMEAAGVAILLFLCTYQLFRRSNKFIAFVIWMLFTSLMNKAWLASSGGQQLISNMLFWLILLPDPRNPAKITAIGGAAFWIIRLQLVVAYAATGLHKLTGGTWVSGDAMGVVASDPLYGPGWLLQWPLLMKLLTWSVLFFQLSFPFAIWWRRTRLPWMAFGSFFHLATGLLFKIPEMALAFLCCYSIWLNANEAGALLGRIKKFVPAATRAHPRADPSAQAHR